MRRETNENGSDGGNVATPGSALRMSTSPRGAWAVQGKANYSADENAVYAKTHALIRQAWQGRAVPEHMELIENLDLPPDRLPSSGEVEQALTRTANMQVLPVGGLVPLPQFFYSLFVGKFPVTVEVRRPDDVAFSAAPDFVHDCLGHLPLLAEPNYGAFSRQLGAAGQRVRDRFRHLERTAGETEAVTFASRAFQALGRLTWFTVEAGILVEAGAVRAYGGALLSSYKDLISATQGAYVDRQPFHLDTVLDCAYDDSGPQQKLFFVQSLTELPSLAHELERRIDRDELPRAQTSISESGLQFLRDPLPQRI